MPAAIPTPPIAPERPNRIVRHGEASDDPYAWLKDPDWRAVMRDPERLDADIRAYLEAENAYAAAATEPTEALRETLFAELKGRIREDESTAPMPDGAYAYYVRYETGGQHPKYCRRRGDDAPEQLLLDGDREARAHAFFRIGACRHSPRHDRIAYSVDLNGAERFTLRIRDLGAGADLPDRIDDAKGDAAWANDGETLFYTLLDDDHRPHRVFAHVVGTDPAGDRLVYEEQDPGFFVGLERSESGRFIAITAHDHETSEVHLIPADAPEEAPATVAPREPGVRYEVAHHGERLFILTNADGAEDFKIVEAPVATPGRAHWRDWLAHEPGRLLRSILAFGGHLVRCERSRGLPRIVVAELPGGAEHAIAFDEEAYDLRAIRGYEFETTTLRFAYSSMTTPEQTFDYDMATRRRTLRKQQEVPSGHDAARYVTRRLFATGRDGAQVPISLLHRRDTPRDGSAPLLLYGYGAYGYATPAAFSTTRLSLVDRGFVYAIAHVRGGTDQGYGWYLAGKLDRKTNSFLDFIAAAERLIEARYTGPGNVAIHGGSAGGMLVGAVANMRPDLLRAVVAEVPFVDVLNTMCDADLPLTPPEWPEWGNPIDDAAAYRRIKSYSPFDNVAARDYPHMLATAGLTDPRVTYWEPAKWVARLRARKTDDNLLVLKTNMEAGHAGAAGRFDRLREVAFVQAFLLQVFDMAGAEREGQD